MGVAKTGPSRSLEEKGGLGTIRKKKGRYIIFSEEEKKEKEEEKGALNGAGKGTVVPTPLLRKKITARRKVILYTNEWKKGNLCGRRQGWGTESRYDWLGDEENLIQ